MKIKRCNSCGAYTMKGLCPRCSAVTSNPYPPSFSPEDKYGKYRRIEKLKAEPKTKSNTESNFE